MSTIRTPLAARLALGLVATLIAAAPTLAEAKLQPLVAKLDKTTVGTAVLREARPLTKGNLAMNVVAACTRTGARMVC